eukprot:CAMPEP_0177783816 /NCGR_PEP_ID=MMETSP0491_2-20121128/19330_1 /TAXON_ID=63592 /ORGANISM="Tetraselmis chuii, Strain PLY429" /LENGTH=145 /DNA_ID=CAMNT_0019304463 /DNA_START=286 /DNA_END=723 /DNA_ORIENTATION=+
MPGGLTRGARPEQTPGGPNLVGAHPLRAYLLPRRQPSQDAQEGLRVRAIRRIPVYTIKVGAPFRLGRGWRSAGGGRGTTALRIPVRHVDLALLSRRAHEEAPHHRVPQLRVLARLPPPPLLLPPDRLDQPRRHFGPVGRLSVERL